MMKRIVAFFGGWGPRKSVKFCGERIRSEMRELSCLHGSEGYETCNDEGGSDHAEKQV